ncbi:MAG: thioredoxin [Candidatus Blackburnbacteria bacterium RIFCSPHIGHO2_02_FULL_39_13]|nr:MAG: lpbca thioredoxin [Microgenomates group bacterium GW2011_GWA2_39_19]OGY08864.1 MAG: thioredoxin [Candidatus Blackburnbacteria bacterium RIFCSPHIGHO2_02_FULL_39_13]
MALIDVTDQDFRQKVTENKTPVLVDLHAVWCGPCRLAGPILEELSKEYEGKIDFVKIDVDKNPASAQALQVMSIPTTILFKDGKEVGRQIGFGGRKPFEDLLAKA